MEKNEVRGMENENEGEGLEPLPPFCSLLVCPFFFGVTMCLLLKKVRAFDVELFGNHKVDTGLMLLFQIGKVEAVTILVHRFFPLQGGQSR